GLEPGYWGQYYARKSIGCPNAQVKGEFAKASLHYLDAFLQETNPLPETLCPAYLQKGRLMLSLGNAAEASVAFRAAESLAREQDLWKFEVLVAKAYLERSNLLEAQQHLQRAIAHAPPNEKERLAILFRPLLQQAQQPPKSDDG